jgi:hypothetical protein
MEPVTDAASFRERTEQMSTARSRAEEPRLARVRPLSGRPVITVPP